MTHRMAPLFLVVAVAAFVGFAAFASPGPGAAIEIARAAPVVGPGFSDSFTVDCGATATVIQAPASTMRSYTCQNTSTTKVAVGDSGIGDPTSGQNSPIHCATNCPSQEFGGNVMREYCRADTGTVTIYCRGMVDSGSAP